jgi:hypothetical protein
MADLTTWWEGYQLESLSLSRAAEETGYTYSAIEKMVRSGRLENAGKKEGQRCAVRTCL